MILASRRYSIELIDIRLMEIDALDYLNLGWRHCNQSLVSGDLMMDGSLFSGFSMSNYSILSHFPHQN